MDSLFTLLIGGMNMSITSQYQTTVQSPKRTHRSSSIMARVLKQENQVFILCTYLLCDTKILMIPWLHVICLASKIYINWRLCYCCAVCWHFMLYVKGSFGSIAIIICHRKGNTIILRQYFLSLRHVMQNRNQHKTHVMSGMTLYTSINVSDHNVQFLSAA